MDDPELTTTFRIPGRWDGPEDFASRLPAGCRVEGDALTLEGGAAARIVPAAPDGEFAAVFEGSCRRPLGADEREDLRGYAVNILLTCPAGSAEKAAEAMRLAAAVVEAGGAGVFIDNSGLSHGAADWLAMAGAADLDALTFAYVGMITDGSDVTTMGMRAFGRPDFVMSERDAGDAREGELDPIIQVMQYLAGGDREVAVGHVIAGADERAFRVSDAGPDPFEPGSPMHNPAGRLRLKSFRDIAASN